MTRLIAGLSLALLVSACGADGYPTEPRESPISISGETRIGVANYGGNISNVNETDLSINLGF